MAIYRVTRDEWWPFYSLYESGEFEIELSDEEKRQIDEALNAIDAAQELIAKKIDKK